MQLKINETDANITPDNFRLSSIKKTSNNNIVDVSTSLMGFVEKLPEYSCSGNYETKISKFSLRIPYTISICRR
jgi:hypothetical protein